MGFIFVFISCIKHRSGSSYLNKIVKEWFVFLAFKNNTRKPEEKDLQEHKINNLKTAFVPVCFFTFLTEFDFRR